MRKRSKVIIIIAIIAVLITSLVGCTLFDQIFPGSDKPFYQPTGDPPSGTDFVYKDIIDRAITGAVCISAGNAIGNNFTAKSSGSGFIITADGYVVTNKHVVEGSSAFRVSIIDDNNEVFTYKAALEPRPPFDDTDIAVLKIQDSDAKDVTFKPLKFADSNLVDFGDPCVIIGNPKGIGFMCARGMVGNPNMSMNNNSKNLIAIDAPINPGNSGGALINGKCEVIGVITYRHSSTGTVNDVVLDIGFAQKSNDVVNYLRKYPSIKDSLAYHV